MRDERLERWVDGPHLRLELRSAVAVSTRASRAVKRRAVAAVQSGGTRGATIQRLIGVPFSVLPAAMLARLPRLRVTTDAGLAVSREAARDALRRADEHLGGAVRDVIWLVPPTSDGARVSALLVGVDGPVAHLRITDLPPVHRPAPSVGVGRRTGVRWPMVLNSWEHEGVVVELTDALNVGRSEPTDLDAQELADLISDLQDALGPGPEGSVAAHGDLTPWNLRTGTDGQRVLFDWEHRTYGPDGIDLVRFLLASGAGPARFAELPTAERRRVRGGIEYLLELADARDATRRTEELTDWKVADLAAERSALRAMLDLAG